MVSAPAPHAEDTTIITSEIAVEDFDRHKRRITRVFWSTRKFQIYESGGEVRYNLPEDYDTAAALRANVFGLIEARSNVERLRRANGVPTSECDQVASEVAGALAAAFETDPASEAAKQPLQMLQRTEGRLLSLIKSQFRKRYLLGVALAFVLVVAALIAFMAATATTAASFGHLDLVRLATFAGYCVFGALGALFSVAWRIERLDFRTDIGLWEYFVAGLIRVGIGVVAGIVVGLALQSQFIVLNFGQQSTETGDPALVVYYLIAFVAGFSESLVPNILGRGEELANGGLTTGEGVTEPASPGAPTGPAVPPGQG
jgi:hypothetical protein